MKIGFIYTDSKMLNQAQQIMAFCTEKGAVDELGIGRIRDAFSNALFPGISSLQTRAKYFTVLPLIYESLAKGKWKDVQEVRNALRLKDKDLAALLNASQDPYGGIVGASFVKTDKMVKYDASYIYAGGLQTFGIIDNPNNVQISKLIFDASKKRRETDITTDEATESLHQARYWSIPDTYDWEKGCRITLTKSEADFLKRKICSAPIVKGGHTLLVPMLRCGIGAKELVNYTFADLPIDKLSLTEETRYIYHIAKDFAEFIHGIYLRYNVLLARNVEKGTGEVTTRDPAIVERFEKWLDSSWKGGGLRDRVDAIWAWASKARMTDTSCLTFCQSAAKSLDVDDELRGLDRLITLREKTIKQSRRKINNPGYYTFEPGHYVQDHLLDYRWTTARRIIADIKIGEKCHE